MAGIRVAFAALPQSKHDLLFKFRSNGPSDGGVVPFEHRVYILSYTVHCRVKYFRRFVVL